MVFGKAISSHTPSVCVGKSIGDRMDYDVSR